MDTTLRIASLMDWACERTLLPVLWILARLLKAKRFAVPAVEILIDMASMDASLMDVSLIDAGQQ